MPFLRKKDYYYLIQSDKLNVVLDDDDTFMLDAERATEEEISSYLRHRYDVTTIFKEILTFGIATQFYEGDLVEYSETAYDTSATYNTNDRCSYSGYIYKAKEDGVTGAWNATKWTQVVANETLYTCKVASLGNYPESAFAYTAQAYTENHDLIKGWDRENVTLYFERDDKRYRKGKIHRGWAEYTGDIRY